MSSTSDLCAASSSEGRRDTAESARIGLSADARISEGHVPAAVGARLPIKPTAQLAALRRATAGDGDAVEEFARWTYGEMRRVLRRYGRRWPADDFDDAVQLAVCHVVERLGHCRAENDYQLRARVALIGWRAVLRERIERRSLDARPGGGRHDAGTVLLHDADDADALLGVTPGAADVLLIALVVGLGDAPDGTRAIARRASPVLPSAQGAVPSATATAMVLPSVDAGVGSGGRTPAAPPEPPSEEVAPTMPASERPTSAARPAAACARARRPRAHLSLSRDGGSLRWPACIDADHVLDATR